MDEQNTTQVDTTQDTLVSEIAKWEALWESAKALANGEATEAVVAIEAKVNAMKTELEALKIKAETVKAEVVAEVTQAKQSFLEAIAPYHATVNTIIGIVVLLKMFGVI